MLTRAEKEELVKQLYEEGKTIREIAKVVHMSFTDIAAIIRKVTGESSKDSNNKPTLSKETEALKLFKKGRTAIEVAILLDASPDDAENWYMDYWRLMRQYHLALLYKEIKMHLPSFIKLYRLFRSAGITEEDSVNIINNSKQLPSIRNTFMELTNAIANLEPQRDNLLSEISSLQNEIERRENYLQICQGELAKMNFKVLEKHRELQYLEQLINDKSREYTRYK